MRTAKRKNAMTKLGSILCGAAALAALSGCAYENGYYDNGPYAHYDGYYDGYYGPYGGGYWGNDGFFYYSDSSHHFHRDEGNHFRHEGFSGGHPFHADHDADHAGAHHDRD